MIELVWNIYCTDISYKGEDMCWKYVVMFKSNIPGIRVYVYTSTWYVKYQVYLPFDMYTCTRWITDITMYKCVFLAHGHFFSSSRGFFLVLLAPLHAGSPPEHQGPSVGPGRRPWHVLWWFKVASSHGEAFRARRAIQVPENPRKG